MHSTGFRQKNARSVVALMGSYRKSGTIDTIVSEILRGAQEAGARTRKIDLVDQVVEFCENCRECCRTPGGERVPCLRHDDDVEKILKALEGADGIVLGAPVNFGDVNAMTRRLLERMVGYGYWPREAKAPRPRKAASRKPAVLVTSSTAPAILTRWFAKPLWTLGQMAKLLGAHTERTLIVGLADALDLRSSSRIMLKARHYGRELAQATLARPRTASGERDVEWTPTIEHYDLTAEAQASDTSRSAPRIHPTSDYA